MPFDAREPLVVFAKSVVKQHERRNPKTGAMETVHEYSNKRMRRPDRPHPLAEAGGPDAPHTSGPGHGHPRPADRRHPPGHEAARIPTRLITGKEGLEAHAAEKGTKAHRDVSNTIGMAEMRQDPERIAHAANLLRAYSDTPEHMKGASDEALVEHTINRLKDNVLWLHDQVPEETRQRSKLWYDGARKITDRWAGEYGLDHKSVAGAIAALSPQKDWYMNVSCAKRVLDFMTEKRDHVFDDGMQKTLDRLGSLNKYTGLVKLMQGASLKSLDALNIDDGVKSDAKAMFFRLYDETHNDKSYPVLTPEGDTADNVKNNPDKKGNRADAKMGWGSLNEIGKAIRCVESGGDLDVISTSMGKAHKVRNFYNNIVAPNSAGGEITADTHAIAAAHLMPLAGQDEAVCHGLGTNPSDKEAFKKKYDRDFQGAGGSVTTGVQGTYGMYADAYRRAAAERGILPREMQSITWEAVRGMFSDTYKSDASNFKKVDAIWRDASSGKLGVDAARNQIRDAAGGIEKPTWHPEHPDNRAKAAEGGGGADGGRPPGVPEADRGSADPGKLRGRVLAGEDVRGPGAGGRGADPRGAAGAGRDGGAAAAGRDGGDFDSDPAGGAVGEEGKPRVHGHGDRVRFTHGDPEGGVQVRGEGEIRGSGPDGVRVRTDDGREHKVRFEHLEGAKPKAKPRIGRGRALAPVAKAFLAFLVDPLGLAKTHVKQHERRNPKTGAMETVHEHEDKRAARRPDYPERRDGEADDQYVARVKHALPHPDHLPEDHDRYFYRLANHREVPVDSLVPTRDHHPDNRPSNAAKLMAMASHGVIGKRDPIDVRARPDGRLDIVDGHGTLEAAKTHGWKTVLVRDHDAAAPAAPPPLFDDKEAALPKEAKQPVADKDALFEKSRGALEYLKSWLDEGKGVCSKMGHTIMDKAPDDVGEDEWNRPGGMLFIARLKGEKRAQEKVDQDYGGDWSKLLDTVRCTIAVDSHDDLIRVWSVLKEHDVRLARAPKDRFAKPVPVGYRDALLNVAFPNGVLGELQLHLKPMLRAKNEGHHHYEVERTLTPKVEAGTATPEERDRLLDAQVKMKALYEAAWRDAAGASKKGKSDD